jgi:ATP-dependent Lon protease
MKDYLANGRFSRGVEVIADASMAFVGNIDQSVAQLVHSTDHDLFLPLPKEFDLAIQDRLYCYLPGWEIPKNSSAYLTNNYGFITDYLAEAFHYQLKHSNRYEEVNRRIRLGAAVEGRDEMAIKKTVCAFLKILHPAAEPTDSEFEEYVAYAVEARRRVKEQMNKRKPDDEFALIDLSYFTADGEEVIVYCPESKGVAATQTPDRKDLFGEKLEREQTVKSGAQKKKKSSSVEPVVEEAKPDKIQAETIKKENTEEPVEPELKEQHFTIFYNDTGFSYESIIGPYLQGAKQIVVEDPFIRATHQVQNFVRFCEMVVRDSSIAKVELTTSYDDNTNMSELHDKLEDVKQSMLEQDVELEIHLNSNMHDREIRLDNGWVIKIGRGLDFFQRPTSWFEIGVTDLSLRKCLETKIDIFRG